MRTSNPIFKNKVFNEFNSRGGMVGTNSDVMTVQGTVNKSFILLACLLASTGYTWYIMATMGINPYILIAAGAIGGLILALITSFNPKASPFTAPLYAVLEGLFVGAISVLLEFVYPGIVVQAVSLTFGVFLVMLVAYKMGYIKATEQFRSGVIAATGAIFVVYLVSWIMRMFNMPVTFLHDGGIISIVFSLIVVGIAALNLILDFNTIEEGSEMGLPKYMEWYAGFGLLVTIVWLYIEILNLLSKLNRD